MVFELSLNKNIYTIGNNTVVLTKDIEKKMLFLRTYFTEIIKYNAPKTKNFDELDNFIGIYLPEIS